MNNLLSNGKITHFLSEKGNKNLEILHFNIFFVSKTLPIRVLLLSLLTQYIKINYKEEKKWQIKEH